MKNLLRNSLIASVVAVAGATAFAGQANAQSVDVNFNGTVKNSCEITKLKDGKLGFSDIATGEFVTSRPDESSKAELGEIQVNCIGSGEISVTVPTPVSPDAISFARAQGYVNGAQIYNSDSNFDDVSTQVAEGSSGPGSATLALNGTSQKLYVHVVAFVPGKTNIPAGNYEYKTTVSITPQ